MKDLLREVMNPSSLERMTADAALNHPYFLNITEGEIVAADDEKHDLTSEVTAVLWYLSVRFCLFLSLVISDFYSNYTKSCLNILLSSLLDVYLSVRFCLFLSLVISDFYSNYTKSCLNILLSSLFRCKMVGARW